MTLPSAEAEQQQNTESHAVTVPRFNAKLAVLRGVVKSQVGGEGGIGGGAQQARHSGIKCCVRHIRMAVEAEEWLSSFPTKKKKSVLFSPLGGYCRLLIWCGWLT